MTPEDLVETACPKVGDLGWAFYFVPETLATGRELGLDGFRFYFLGRGGVLGDVEGRVVASAFGYFNPSLVEDMWSSGSKIVAPRTAGRAFVECAAAFGRTRLADVAGLDEFCAAADAVNDAADPTGLALYAAAAAEPLADDAPARAMQLVALLREFRGSAHLIALRACGVDARTAHFIKRPGDSAMFGWPADVTPPVSAEQRAAVEAAEVLTDTLVRPAYAVLDDAGATALVRGLDDMAVALTD